MPRWTVRSASASLPRCVPMRGRLSEDVQPPGVGAFAGLTPAAPEPPAPTPERERAQRVAAVARARANLDDARSRIDRLESEIATLRDQLRDARRAAEAAAVELAETESSEEPGDGRAHEE